MRPAQEGLLSLVERIFEYGVVTASERSELASLYRGAGLTVPEVKEVFAAFLKKTWGETIADGLITNEERTKLATIVRELRMPVESVPALVESVPALVESVPALVEPVPVLVGAVIRAA